jgi:hypothetical protein
VGTITPDGRSLTHVSGYRARSGMRVRPHKARQHKRVLRICVDHYNTHRPHRALRLEAPAPGSHISPVRSGPRDKLHRRDRLGGLIHEYARAA